MLFASFVFALMSVCVKLASDLYSTSEIVMYRGLIGVTLLLRPSIHAEQWVGSVFALISGVVSAFAYLQVRHLGQLGEPEYRVVFYFSLTGLIAGLPGSLVTDAIGGDSAVAWNAHTGTGLALLLGIGITATVAQIVMTRAYRLGKVLITANLQYTGIVFSSLLGILIWGDLLHWLGWLGIGVILVSGIAATFYNAHMAKAALPSSKLLKPIRSRLKLKR
jgi:S-adenosylmethionine uptake transporter